MRRILPLMLAVALGLSGCASSPSRIDDGVQREPEAVGFLRESFKGANWGPWTPEFPPPQDR